MKAIVQHGYGDTDVLTFSDIPTPAIGPQEVLIQVRAAAVDAGVWHLMTGTPYLLRLGFGLTRPRKRVRGMDVAGLVEAVGENVTDFQPGDEVFGTCEGSFAEYATTHHTKLTRKPRNLTHQQAAAIPISAFTALAALRDKGEVEAGQRVLVIGAGGGVGSYAVQLGKVFGAVVTGLCSTSKVEFVRALGADQVLDYTQDDFTRDEYDLIIDIAGNRPINHVRKALSARGTLVIVGGERGKVIGGAAGLLKATVMNLFTGHTLRGLISLGNKEDLAVLRDLAEAGRIVPAIDREYQLSEVPDAIAHARAGRARGKIVITV
nr:NAD(P)-dependent alcohol dehydrogenase [Kibdelosporangium sp. MJ126-NF4]CEL13970.1 Bifunctional protein: zinc-containing alcohol dehydrogenase; quinone oxidoreductase (NADPH:quinone reductase); Similar to arginate lyase [Kibdelosporangium sp. MJ126-NF4]CTQ88339.1 Bifunctional protein: zinc-containing alcohol dehydrogenase; quinone oxidoreductase (NADPH:quinone reductase) (EC 1.1.1.-); Similar to arginate lyase [Kibdelosporangium sp. MJ126-NF4]